MHFRYLVVWLSVFPEFQSELAVHSFFSWQPLLFNLTIRFFLSPNFPLSSLPYSHLTAIFLYPSFPSLFPRTVPLTCNTAPVTLFQIMTSRSLSVPIATRRSYYPAVPSSFPIFSTAPRFS